MRQTKILSSGTFTARSFTDIRLFLPFFVHSAFPQISYAHFRNLTPAALLNLLLFPLLIPWLTLCLIFLQFLHCQSSSLSNSQIRIPQVSHFDSTVKELKPLPRFRFQMSCWQCSFLNQIQLWFLLIYNQSKMKLLSQNDWFLSIFVDSFDCRWIQFLNLKWFLNFDPVHTIVSFLNRQKLSQRYF